MIRGYKDIDWTAKSIEFLDLVFPCNRKVFNVREDESAQEASQVCAVAPGGDDERERGNEARGGCPRELRCARGRGKGAVRERRGASAQSNAAHTRARCAMLSLCFPYTFTLPLRRRFFRRP